MQDTGDDNIARDHEQTLGMGLVEETIRREGRVRLTYERTKLLRRVESIDQLIALCDPEGLHNFSADASTDEILNAWLTPDPNESDASSVGGFFANDLEGCLLSILLVPVLFVGVSAGATLRWCGLSIGDVNDRRWLRGLSACGPVFGALALWLAPNPWWIFAPVVGSFIGGQLFAQNPRKTMDAVWSTVVVSLCTAVSAYLYVRSNFTMPVWLVLVPAIAMGMGYGSVRSWSDLFKRRVRKPAGRTLVK